MPQPCFVRPICLMVILLSVMDRMPAFLSISKAVINPVDVLVFFGEKLKVYCNLIETSEFNASRIYFRITAGSHILLIKDQMVVVNETSAFTIVDITNTTHVDHTTYECMAGKHSLKSIIIYTQYPFQNVSDFGGVYYYNLDKTILTWQLGVDYLTPDYIVVSTDWNANSSPNLKYSRNCTHQTKESCSIDHGGEATIFIRINISSIINRPSPEFVIDALPATAVSVHKFVLPYHMKTAPASNFKVMSKTNHCFNLTWKDPVYFDDFFSNSTYKIKIMKIIDEKAQFETVLENKRPYINREDPVELCELQPHTNYTLSLSVKAMVKNPWSDTVNVTAMTKEDRPAKGPPLTSTSYHTEECYGSERKLLLYWNKTTPSSLNGQLTKYVVKYNNLEVPLRPGSNYFETVLNCSASYNISVFSATKVGESVLPSKIFVPSEEVALQVPANFQFKVQEIFNSSVSLTEKNVTVSWNSRQIEEHNVSLVLYMCRESYIEHTCFDDFKALEVNVSNDEIALLNLSKDVDLFGYALINADGISKGIEWTDCVFRSELKPKKPTNVRVITGSNSMEVIWTASRCNKKHRILILQYNIIVCEGEHLHDEAIEKNCRKYVIESEAGTVFELKNLQTDQQYYVYVQSVSYAGGGALSDPVMAVTEGSDVPDVVIIMSVLITVIILGAFIFYVLWKCRQSKKYHEALMKDGCESIDGFINVSFKTVSHSSCESGFHSDSSKQNLPTESPSVPPMITECPYNPGNECTSFQDDATDNLPQKSDFQDAKSSKELRLINSENINSSSDVYLRITNTKLTCSGSATSTNEENDNSTDSESVSRSNNNDFNTHPMPTNQLGSLANPLKTESLNITSLASVDEGFSLPSAESSEPEPQFRRDGYSHQIQTLHGDTILFTEIPETYSDISRRHLAISEILDPQQDQPDFSSQSSENHSVECYAKLGVDTDGNQHNSSWDRDALKQNYPHEYYFHDGKESFSPSYSFLQNSPTLKEPGIVYQQHSFIQNPENVAQACNIEDGRFHGHQLPCFTTGFLDTQSHSANNMTLTCGSGFMMDNQEIQSDTYKSQNFVTDCQDIQMNSPSNVPHRFLLDDQYPQLDGYKFHSLMVDPLIAQSDNCKSQNFKTDSHVSQCDGYKSHSFINDRHDTPYDDCKPQSLKTDHQGTQPEGFKPQIFMIDHPDIRSDGHKPNIYETDGQSDGYTPHSFIRENQDVQPDGYKPHSYVTDHQEVQSDGYKPHSFIRDHQDVQSDGYKPHSYLTDHQDIQSDGYTPHSFIRENQDIQSDSYTPHSYVIDHQDIQSDGYTPHSFIKDHQDVHSDGYKPHSYAKDHQDIQSDGYTPHSFIRENQDVQSDGYTPHSYVTDHQDIQSDGYRPNSFIRENQDVQSDGYKPDNYVTNHREVQSDDYKLHSL